MEPQKTAQTLSSAEWQGAEGALPRRISLSEATINGTGVSVVDLTAEAGPIEFDASGSFFDYLGKGNRILFRLRGLGQLAAVADLAFENTLSFEFDRTAEGVSILLFKRGTHPGGRVSGDEGTGI